MSDSGAGGRRPRAAAAAWRLATVGAALLLLAAGSGAAAAAVPGRVVSINLCTDQYLLALARPDQIVALSPNAHDPSMSYFAEAAARFPLTGASAEAVMALRPDLVLAARFGRRTTRALLKRLGYRVLELPPAESVADIREQIAQVAAAIGAQERGAALTAGFERRMAVSREQGEATGPLALYYQRRGFATGTGTLVDAAIRAAGLRNAAARLGLHGTGRLPLETVIAGRPDLLILDGTGERTVDRGTELLAHPALDRLVPPRRRVTVPQRLIACGGPWLAEAVELLRARAARLAVHGRATHR